MIEINELNISFKQNVILNHINIKIEESGAYGFVGRNGSGKTVLFKAICGLIPITSGEILVNGKKIGKDVEILDDAGIIIERPGFVSALSGIDNLINLARIRNRIKRSECAEAMQLMGLNPADKKPVSTYSLGMKQRLGIAQAIMEDPSILILDEPMNSLDLEGVRFVRDRLIELKNKGKTILMASHIEEDIGSICDQVFFLHKGAISDTPFEV